MSSAIPVVQSSRIRVLKQGSGPLVGPVVYWMFRDQRIRDNWALIHAVDQANKANVPVAIAFNLFDQFLAAKARQLGFMVIGLEQLHRHVENTLQIPFFLFQVQNICPTHSCPSLLVRPTHRPALSRLSDQPTGLALSFLIFQKTNNYSFIYSVIDVLKGYTQAVDTFLEEMIVRRELADNFCYYQPQYDSLLGAWEWARKTLMEHSADKREHIYTRESNWRRHKLQTLMYWAKKILEWTSGPEEALAITIYLNDKYHIDGRDPSGYVGCMWSNVAYTIRFLVQHA
ncbi:hypothetical protein RND71_016615 [Anisodus tanguticus]|uniref:Photolyase/cryptochrome alpha/beta domain-containing protein n=1 Tax=Anisodus tanguticus TaxID=243964 RepID=A0AAE1VDX6_9SOLA|nr:hypothetical protein RND71_016615 [Anisodus tanguticus]